MASRDPGQAYRRRARIAHASGRPGQLEQCWLRQERPGCQTLFVHPCTGFIQLQDSGRGPWTILTWGFQACPVRFALLEVETLGPWGGPGQRTSRGLPALAVPGRQGNMWTLAGVSRVGALGS